MFNNSYFKVRCFPNGNDRYDDFINNNRISLGWGKIQIAKGDSKEKVIAELKNPDYHYSFKNDHSLAVTAGFFCRLLAMKPSDRILIPYNNKTVTIAEVVGQYEYIPENIDTETAHTVPIKVLKTVHVNNLSPALKKSIDSMLTISQLDDYSEEIEKIINDESINTELSIKSTQQEVYVLNETSEDIMLTINPNVSNNLLNAFIQQIINQR